MKFTCLQENLSKGLNVVSRAVPVKHPLPITTHILIETKNGRLKLSATNLDTAITTYVGAQIEEEGSITVPARLIKDFIATLSPSTVTGNLSDSILHISSQKTKSKFNGISAAEFPAIPELPTEATTIEIDPKLFANAVTSVAFSASTDESRPVFTGIYLNMSENILTIAACDGFRLAEKTIQLEGNYPEFTTIIPSKTLLEIAKVFSGSAEPLKFVLNNNENLVLFSSEDTLIASRILDGQYPDYKRIIPVETSVKAEFSGDELLEAVKLTNLFSKEATSAVKMKLVSDGNIVLTSAAEETGEHESNIDAQIDGTELEIAFNSKYLLDFLNNIKSERLIMETKGHLLPCKFKSPEHDNLIHIIMPMQVQ